VEGVVEGVEIVLAEVVVVEGVAVVEEVVFGMEVVLVLEVVVLVVGELDDDGEELTVVADDEAGRH